MRTLSQQFEQLAGRFLNCKTGGELIGLFEFAGQLFRRVQDELPLPKFSIVETDGNSVWWTTAISVWARIEIRIEEPLGGTPIVNKAFTAEVENQWRTQSLSSCEFCHWLANSTRQTGEPSPEWILIRKQKVREITSYENRTIEVHAKEGNWIKPGPQRGWYFVDPAIMQK